MPLKFNIMKVRAPHQSLMALLLLALLAACNPNPQAVVTDESIDQIEVDSTRSGLINVGGTLFSIPSPIQTAMLIKESGARYDNALLNNPRNVQNYTSRTQKALNLGVYGADLGYATVFNDNEAAVKYMTVVEKLAADLEVTGALDRNLLKRLANNTGNQDSMLILTSNFFRAGDAYLKDNDRADIAALILCGGWVEAAYFTGREAANGNLPARTRLAEQRLAIENLHGVLSRLSMEEVKPLIGDIEELKTLYSQVEYAYQYERPETYPDQQITFINSSSSASMADSTLQQINDRLVALRTKTAG